MPPPEPTPPSPDSAAKVNRLEKAMEVFAKALEGWENDHPDWRVEVLLWVLDCSLASLRAYIETETESEITWDSPYVELHFPVDCVWDEGSTEANPSFRFDTGNLSTTDLVDDKSESAAMSRLLIRHIEIAALQEWTNYSAYEKRGESLRPIGRVEDVERVKAISDPGERARVGKALFRGKSFGAGTIDYEELDDGDQIGGEAAEQLAAIAPPLIFIPLEINGHRIRLITILEIKPPIADADKKKAYFPIVVGIAIQADGGEEITPDWLDQPWAKLSAWPKEAHDEIWEGLRKLIEASLDSLGPKSEPEMIEAILSVNAEIKVVARKGDEAKIQRAIADALAQLQKNGEILRLDISQSVQTGLVHDQAKKLRNSLEAVERSVGSDEKGRSLEKLMADLFSTIPQFCVTERTRTETEEIDLWIANNAGDGPFRREGDIILVECKNWSGKCGKNEFNSLLMKMMNRGQRCTIGFLVSWNGFAGSVVKEMLRGSRDNLLIVPLEGSDLCAAISSEDFLAVITERRNRALMI